MFNTLAHLAVSIVIAQVIRPILGIEWVIVAVLALLPDIDTPRSLLGKLFPSIAHTINLHYGHRTLTHSIFAITFIGIVEYFIIGNIGIFTAAYSAHIGLDLFVGRNGVALFYPLDRNTLTITAWADDGRAPRFIAVVGVIFVSVLFVWPLAQISAIGANNARDIGAFKALPTPTPAIGTLIFINNAHEIRANIGDFVRKGQILGISNNNGVAQAVRSLYSGVVDNIDGYQDQNSYTYRIYINRIDFANDEMIPLVADYYGWMLIGDPNTIPISTPQPHIISRPIVTPTPIYTVLSSSPTPHIALLTVTPSNNLPAGERCTINHVSDGDTISCIINGKKETIRLIGIDTPESVKPNTPVQCGALDASAYTKKMLMDVTVTLEKDKSERDRYSRLLRYVYLPDGEMFNEVLVAQGLAKAYKYPPDVRETARFNTAQSRAQAAKLGIWGACSK